MGIANAFRTYWYVLLLSIILTTTISVGGSLFLPQKYVSEATVLVIQSADEGFEAKAASKSAARIAKTLEQVSDTTTFRKSVIANPGYKVEDTFPKNPVMRKAAWNRTVSLEAKKRNGTIGVRVEHENRAQARALAFSTVQTLIDRASDYHGGGESVYVKLIDEPATSVGIAEPNVFLNGLYGAGVGLVLGLFMLFLLQGSVREEEAIPEDVLAGIRSELSFGSVMKSYVKSAAKNAVHAEDLSYPEEDLGEVEVMPVSEEEDDDIDVPAGVEEEAVSVPAEPVAKPARKERRAERRARKKSKGDEKKKKAKPVEIAKAPPQEAPRKEAKRERRSPVKPRKNKTTPSQDVPKPGGTKPIAREHGAMSVPERGARKNVASFKGGLQELRNQMRERKEEREKQMHFDANPLQRNLANGDAAPVAAPNLFAEKMKEEIEKRREADQAKPEPEPEGKTTSDDQDSVENWIRTGSFGS